MKIAGIFKEEKVDQFVTKEMLDKEARRKLNHFLEQIDLAIFTANKEVIQRDIPDLNRDSFLHFAVVVAEARSRYLKFALELSKVKDPTPDQIEKLKALRLTHDELLAAFDATHRVVKRGYAAIS